MKKLTGKIDLLENIKRRILRRIAVAVCLAVLLAFVIASVTYSENISNGLADRLIRLHVVANSDSEEDQALKQAVRDTVIESMKEWLKDCEGLEQARETIINKLPDIEKLALEEVRKFGKDYPVEAMLGDFPFPTKVYGDIALPAGNYQALRIEIGKAEGANWWCVLFPPLCFVDATHGTVPEEVKEELKSVLTTEEYSVVASAHSEKDIPVKIKFKIVEFLQDSKIKVLAFLTKLFGLGD